MKYAKVDEGDRDGYGMAHTADVFLVDAAGPPPGDASRSGRRPPR